MRRPRWRKMTWVLILWVSIILVWAIAGGSSGNHQSVADCLKGGVLSQQTCTDAANAGTGIGVAIVLLIGFFGFVFLGLIWFMTRPKGRVCPACGEHAKRGHTTCRACGHDFAAAARAA